MSPRCSVLAAALASTVLAAPGPATAGEYCPHVYETDVISTD